ncbi:MAG: 3-deoxy-D-manno-octulosonic acid transferase [Gammaproteobacteria bacterium]|nr:3-deoxy-D-manno-octulosonic acid transferase [Gammaproteobacteria bacterium]
MRRLYTLALYCVTPLVLLRLLWRGFRAPQYWQRWGERFSFYKSDSNPGVIWFHAVSVGEVIAASSLVHEVQRRYPGQSLLITTTTPTGSEQVRKMFGDSVQHIYCPYDLPWVVARFLKRFQPRIAIVMETEIWPNLFYQLAMHDVPLLLANARLSARSAQRYARVRKLTRETLRMIPLIAAQTEADAARFIALGADAAHVPICGNIKFDLHIPASLFEQAEALRRLWGENRFVWIAASTHEGEDDIILNVFKRFKAMNPTALLVLVPRHPERFSRVAALAGSLGFTTHLRSEGMVPMADADVFVGDSMGELLLFYLASDLAFVGGSLVEHGGHNPLEPAACGLPIMMGPHTFNFAGVTSLLISNDLLEVVQGEVDLLDHLTHLSEHADERARLGERGRELVAANSGSVQLMADHVDAKIKNASF